MDIIKLKDGTEVNALAIISGGRVACTMYGFPFTFSPSSYTYSDVDRHLSYADLPDEHELSCAMQSVKNSNITGREVQDV